MRRVTQVRRRDGRVVPFDLRRVAEAIHRAAKDAGGDDRFLAEELAGVVSVYLERSHADRIPGTDEVEDAVERVLRETGHAKAARAFVLHRKKRQEARARVEIEDDELGARALPLVDGDGSGRVSAWSASRIADALVEEASLDAIAADDVARAVEARVLSSGLPRVSSSVVRALVDAELFARGHVRPRERQRVVGLPKHDLARRLAEGPADRVPRDPHALAEALGEEMLRPWTLEEVVPAAAAEAHRLGEIHLYDLGAPFSLSIACPSTDALLARHLRGEGATRGMGPRRFAAALGEAALRHATSASRAFVLEDVNVHWAPFVDRLDEDALHAEARELLLSPATLSFPRRGGLLRFEWTLCADVPARLARKATAPPAPPGRTLGDHADAALRAARALLAAADEVRRDGGADRLPLLTLVVPRGTEVDAATRALLREALALAAAGGEPVVVFDAPGLPRRGSRYLRVGPDQLGDPFRFEAGDVSVATVGAVNLGSAALVSGRGGTERFFAEIDRRLALALDAAAARRDAVGKRVGHPDGAFWSIHQAGLALLDLESAFHLVEAVGADRAARILLPTSEPPAWKALSNKVLRYLGARVAEEGRRRELAVAVVERFSPEASARFDEVDAARFGHAAPAALREPLEPLERTVEPGEKVLEPLGPGGGASPVCRLRLPVSTERPIDLDRLLEQVLAASSDPNVVEVAVDPWPRRIVRAGVGS